MESAPSFPGAGAEKPMDTFVSSQFDDFLRFSRLKLLQISPRGELVSLRPRNGDFLGWHSENRRQFNFTDHFLQPNHMTLKLFLKLLEDKEYVDEYFLWKTAGGNLSLPLPCFFRLVRTPKKEQNILVFVRDGEQASRVQVPVSEKRWLYQARYLPGLIHNINGPLGTVMGRIELMQYKHPELRELDELVRVGYRLQAILDNVSFKISQEKSDRPTEVNFNRFLREELTFLNCDLFFKHQVEKVSEFGENIPQFRARYVSLSNAFAECYQFIRQFVDEQKEYVFILKSFLAGNQVGYTIDFLGEFLLEGAQGAQLPVALEGDYLELARSRVPGLDTYYLCLCMADHDAILSLNCQPNQIRVRYEFPLPMNSIQP